MAKFSDIARISKRGGSFPDVENELAYNAYCLYEAVRTEMIRVHTDSVQRAGIAGLEGPVSVPTLMKSLWPGMDRREDAQDSEIRTARVELYRYLRDTRNLVCIKPGDRRSMSVWWARSEWNDEPPQPPEPAPEQPAPEPSTTSPSHVREETMEQIVYPCREPGCEHSFTSYTGRTHHEKDKHGDSPWRIWHCPFCPVKTYSKGPWTKHISVSHHPTKPAYQHALEEATATAQRLLAELPKPEPEPEQVPQEPVTPAPSVVFQPPQPQPQPQPVGEIRFPWQDDPVQPVPAGNGLFSISTGAISREDIAAAVGNLSSIVPVITGLFATYQNLLKEVEALRQQTTTGSSDNPDAALVAENKRLREQLASLAQKLTNII
jgi:hypothetical protein